MSDDDRADGAPSRSSAPDDETVGYKNPPKRTRWRPGQSGNPRGRPPKSKNMATLLAEALDERVAVTEKGRRRTRSKREIIVAQLVNKSASADLKALSMLLGMMAQVEAAAEARDAKPEELDEAEREILKGMIGRLRGGAQ